MTRRGLDWRDRLWSKAAPDANGCLIWRAGSIDRDGYALFHGTDMPGMTKFSRAHRWAYVAAKGAIPEGMEIDHLCNVPACINPDHLEAVTHAENLRRRSIRQTHCIHGHEYTAENTRRTRAGSRYCFTCRQIRRAAERVAA